MCEGNSLSKCLFYRVLSAYIRQKIKRPKRQIYLVINADVILQIGSIFKFEMKFDCYCLENI